MKCYDRIKGLASKFSISMYSQANENSSADRLSVADILSTMANGADEPSSSLRGIDGMTCGIPTRTTPTLTPTTLKNIEQSLLELQSIPPALEHQHQAGFVPPVVSFSGLPTKQEESHWMDDCMQSSDRSLESPGPTSQTPRSKTGRSGGRRPNKDEKLSPEEEERRRVRRERNKLAAARCRKRRMDHTNSLLQETDGLEEKRQNLQNEIHALNAQKDELEFILDAHKATCKIGVQMQHTKNRAHDKLNSGKCSKSYTRPNSLALSSSFNNSVDASEPLMVKGCSELMDASLNTPSTGLYNFESIVEGGNNGQGNLPFVIVSCGSQQRSSSSDLSSPDSVAPPKLVSL